MAIGLPHTSKAQNLFIPGLNRDGKPITLVAQDVGFWQQSQGDAYLPELLPLVTGRARKQVTKESHPKGWLDSLVATTLFVLDQHKVIGKRLQLERRLILSNVVTDTGAQALLNLYNTPGTAGKFFVLHTDNATAVTSSTISSGAQTSIPVNSGGSKSAVTAHKSASFISNATANAPTADATTSGGVDWSYGTANSEIVSGGATQSSATAIAITSYTVAKTHSTGDNVVSRPQTGDAPTAAPAGAIMFNSGSSTSAATGTASVATISGTGIGSRQALWSNLVFTTTSTAGNYTGLVVVNFNTIAGWSATGFYNSLSFPPMTIDSGHQVTLTSYTVKV